jgi:predicted transcriptional regulator
METPIDWQAEARRMRARGRTSDEIAAQLGKTVSTIREVLRGTRQLATAGDDARSLGAGAKLVEPHAPRTLRVILDEGALTAAAAAFAAGEIDRAELMRRITR